MFGVGFVLCLSAPTFDLRTRNTDIRFENGATMAEYQGASDQNACRQNAYIKIGSVPIGL